MYIDVNDKFTSIDYYTTIQGVQSYLIAPMHKIKLVVENDNHV